jgi:p-aminobenzoyl-glutamate transporter AbgT
VSAAPRSCRGQASSEYTVVLGLLVVALIFSALGDSPLTALAAAIKSAYQAFSYAISFSV